MCEKTLGAIEPIKIDRLDKLHRSDHLPQCEGLGISRYERSGHGSSAIICSPKAKGKNLDCGEAVS
jgi:hypothetical protein